jgi:uncharacterized protein (DUF433 family)
MKTEARNHIEQTPGVCGGKPRIAGSRIRVQDIAVLHEYLGKSADEIVVEYPHITLADVHAALTYYYDNLERIEQDIQDGEAFAEEMRAKNPSKILQRLTVAD